jgi:hypothetical protein
MEFAARIERLLPDLSAALLRFPMPALTAVLVWLVLIGNGVSFDDDVIAAGAAAFLASGAVHLFAEGRAGGRKAAVAGATAAAVLAGGLALLAGGFQTSLLLLLPGLVLAVMIAAFLRPNASQGALWLFNLRFGLAALLASVVGVLFGAGLSAIVEALRFLFDVPLPGNLHDRIWATALALVGPVYGLSLMPREIDEEVLLDATGNSLLERGVSVLVNYVLVPLILVYALILHAYAVKIALQWELPKGQIGTMVTIFALGGTAAWLTAWPWRASGTRALRMFLAGWFWITITPAVLLIIAIARRVNDYGVTPDRYALILVAIWLAGLAAYLALRRNQADMRAILGGLAVLLLAGSFGPWGAHGVTIASQYGRLAELLERKGLLRNNLVVEPVPAFDNESRQAGYSMLSALREAGGLDRLRPWFAEARDDPFKDASLADTSGWFADRRGWTLADAISRRLGLIADIPPAEYVSFVANTVAIHEVPAPARLIGPLQVFGYATAQQATGVSALVKGDRLVVKIGDREWATEVQSLLVRVKEELSTPPQLQAPVTFALAPEVSLVFDSLGGRLGDQPQLDSARLWVILQPPPDGPP